MKTRTLTLAMMLTLFVLSSALVSAQGRLRVRLTTVHCVNANEDGWLSNGDEPYVLTSTISNGGLLGRRLQFNGTQTFSDMDAGDDRNPNLTLFLGAMNGSVVVAAQAVEHDDSERALVEDLVRSASQVDFTNAVTNGVNDSWTLGTIVSNAMRGGVDAAALPFVDDDDRIGIPTQFIVSQATFDGLAMNQATTLTRQVAGNGATYQLTFEIRRVP